MDQNREASIRFLLFTLGMTGATFACYLLLESEGALLALSVGMILLAFHR